MSIGARSLSLVIVIVLALAALAWAGVALATPSTLSQPQVANPSQSVLVAGFQSIERVAVTRAAEDRVTGNSPRPAQLLAVNTLDLVSSEELIDASMRFWPDPVDNTGLLDMSQLALSTTSLGNVFISISFWPGYSGSGVGTKDVVWVQMDTDSNPLTGTPLPSYGPVLGYDYMGTFDYNYGNWVFRIFRTPYEDIGTWYLVWEQYAVQGYNATTQREYLASLIPTAYIGNPTSFNFILFTGYKSVLTGEFITDFLPDVGQIGRYNIYPVPTTTTTLPPTTTTTLPPTTITTVAPTTTTTLPPTTTTTTPPTPTFTDVPQWHPYALQINDMASRHVVDGYGAGLFGPEDWVKRQQFAKMIVLGMGYPVSEADVCSFVDVDKPSGNLYPDNYVAVAAARGITLGTSPGHFAPWNDISRAQMITMVARAAGVAEPPAEYSPPFGNFSATHYPWARRAAYAGLLGGLQGMGPGYDFWAPATRGEVCVVLYNLLHR